MRLCRMYPAAARKESAHPDTAGRCLLQNIAKKDRQARRQKYNRRPEYQSDIPGGLFRILPQFSLSNFSITFSIFVRVAVSIDARVEKPFWHSVSDESMPRILSIGVPSSCPYIYARSNLTLPTIMSSIREVSSSREYLVLSAISKYAGVTVR